MSNLSHEEVSKIINYVFFWGTICFIILLLLSLLLAEINNFYKEKKKKSLTIVDVV